MEAGLDKQRWIYGAERRVMDPDCDHGAALVTSQSHHRVCVLHLQVMHPIGRAPFEHWL